MAYSDIKDPSAHFQTALWAGNSSTQTITNDGNSDLQPDMVWNKSRTTTNVHLLQDSTRGTNGTVYRYLQPDSALQELVQSDGDGITSLNSDGFSLGFGNSNSWNSSGNNYVAWQWKANGGTTSSNTDGSKTATVQANQDAGFSIVTYAGSGSTSTVGHGLADTPDMIIFKNRSAANVWATYHQGLGNNYKLELNGNGAQDADGSFMNGTLPTSSVFTVGASVNTNGSGSNYVAYCFAEKQGYSKCGKYFGNGSTNGSFVYTGFRPAFLMMKRIDSTGNWVMFDTKRDLGNVTKTRLFPNLTNSDNTTRNYVDLLSNGFKLRDTDVDHNASGSTIIYMAFAEHPFVAGGIPTTAR